MTPKPTNKPAPLTAEELRALVQSCRCRYESLHNSKKPYDYYEFYLDEWSKVQATIDAQAAEIERLREALKQALHDTSYFIDDFKSHRDGFCTSLGEWDEIIEHFTASSKAIEEALKGADTMTHHVPG